MASSGWQGRQTLYNYSANITIKGDIAINAISHSGTNLRVQGTIALVAEGTSGYRYHYDNGIIENPAYGGEVKILGNGETQYTGDGNTKYANFDVTIPNVPVTQTYYDFPVRYRACFNSNCSSTYWDVTLWWRLTFGSSATAPTGGNITFNSSTWNKVNATSSVSSWGGLAGSFQSIVVTGSYNGDAVNATSENFRGRKCYVSNAGSTSVTTFTTDMSNSNVTMTFENPISIKGLLCYRLAYWHSNSAGVSYGIKSTVRHLPPAKPQFTYTDPGGSGTKSYTVNLTGDLVNNHTTYDAANLTRSIRYKIDSGNWVNVDSDTVAALDFVTTFTVAVPAGSTATVEGWMTYHGMQSEVQTITITNSTAGVALYGSVNGETKLLGPVYASVNGRTRKLKKIYASAGGVTKKVYEDV